MPRLHAAAQERDPHAERRRLEAEQRVAAADAKIERLLAAIEAGADPTLVGEWTTQARTERDEARSLLAALSPDRQITREQVDQVVTAAGGLFGRLGAAPVAKRREVYESIGLRGEYDTAGQVVRGAFAPSWSQPVFRGEDSNPYTRHQKPLSCH